MHESVFGSFSIFDIFTVSTVGVEFYNPYLSRNIAFGPLCFPQLIAWLEIMSNFQCIFGSFRGSLFGNFFLVVL